MSEGYPNAKADLPFGGGVDQHTHDHLLEGPGMEEVQGYEFTKRGALVRRDEYYSIGTATQDTPEAIAEHQGNLVAFGPEGAQRRTSDDTWEALANPGPRALDIEQRTVLRTQRGGDVFKSAAGEKYFACAWKRDDELWFQIDDTESDTTVFGPEKLSAFDFEGFTAPESGFWVVACEEDTANGQITFVVCGRAVGDTSISDPLLMQGFYVDDGIVTEQTALSVFAVVANGTKAHSNKETSDIYLGYRDSGPALRRITSAAGVLTNDSAGFSSSGSSFSVLTVYEGTSAVYLVSTDGSEIEVGAAAVGADLGSVVFPGNTIHTRDSSTDPVYELAYMAERPTDGRLFLTWEGRFAMQASDPACETQAICWAEINSDGTVYLEGSRHIYHGQHYAAPWCDSFGRLLIPVDLFGSNFTGTSSAGDASIRRYGYGQVTDNGDEGFSSRRRVCIAQVDGTGDLAARAVAYMLNDLAITPGRGNSLPGAAGINYPTLTYRLSDGRIAFVSPIEEIEAEFATTSVQGALMSLIREAPRHVDTAHANGTLLASSGYLSYVDGYLHGGVMDQVPPVVALSWTSLSDSGGTGKTGYNGSTQFRFCWFWRDQEGNVHRSAPSKALELSAGSDQYVGPAEDPPTTTFNIINQAAVRLLVPPFVDARAGGIRPADVFLEAYAFPIIATARLDDDGSTVPGDVAENVPDGSHYLCTMQEVDPSTGSVTGTAKYRWPLDELVDTSEPWWTKAFRVTPLRKTRASNPGPSTLQLYTDAQSVGGPGELGNEPPPPPAAMATTRNRVFLVDGDNRKKWWYSSPIVPGQAPRFSPLLTDSIPTEDADLVGIGTTDDFTVLLGSRTVHYFQAIEGPDATGAGRFPEIDKASQSEGCISAASIVGTDLGVFYLGRSGMYVVSPDGGVSALPESEDLFDDETIVGAVVVPEKNQVIWTTQTKNIAFDYRHQQWCTADLESDETETHLIPCSGSLDGRHVIAADDLQAYTTKPLDTWLAEATDAGNVGVTCRFETGWYRLDGLTGYARARHFTLIGRMRGTATDGGLSDDGPGTLTVTTYYDHDEGDFDTYSVAASVWAPAADRDPLRLRLRFQRQKCTAVKFAVQLDPYRPEGEVLNEPVHQWPEWSGIAVEYARLPNLRRQAQSAGGS